LYAYGPFNCTPIGRLGDKDTNMTHRRQKSKIGAFTKFISLDNNYNERENQLTNEC